MECDALILQLGMRRQAIQLDNEAVQVGRAYKDQGSHPHIALGTVRMKCTEKLSRPEDSNGYGKWIQDFKGPVWILTLTVPGWIQDPEVPGWLVQWMDPLSGPRIRPWVDSGSERS